MGRLLDKIRRTFNRDADAAEKAETTHYTKDGKQYTRYGMHHDPKETQAETASGMINTRHYHEGGKTYTIAGVHQEKSDSPEIARISHVRTTEPHHPSHHTELTRRTPALYHTETDQHPMIPSSVIRTEPTQYHPAHHYPQEGNPKHKPDNINISISNVNRNTVSRNGKHST